MIQTDLFTLVLNGQKIGILWAGRSSKELVVNGDNSSTIENGFYCNQKSGFYYNAKNGLLHPSYDHRIISGTLASRFRGSLVEVVENESLLQEVPKM
jgi:pyruvate/2-oxoglutarate dehydrogenase complex dihydrolipoamide acyltransferase (E2) component